MEKEEEEVGTSLAVVSVEALPEGVRVIIKYIGR